MKRITINKTTLQVYPVCLGADKFGSPFSEEDSFRILDIYSSYGGNFLDTAAVYGRWSRGNLSEQIVGRWMKSRKAKNNMIVATKGGHYSFDNPSISRITKKDIESDIHDSLKTLELDTIDFYWLHRDNLALPIEEIIDILEDFRKAGLIRYYGASNYTKDRLEKAHAYAQKMNITGFSAVSNKWSPAIENPEHSVSSDPTLIQFQGDSNLDVFRSTGMSFIPYNSTAMGYFEKKYLGKLDENMQLKFNNEHNEELYNKLLAKAEATHKSIQTLLLEHMISDYDVQIIPITSVGTIEQLNALNLE